MGRVERPEEFPAKVFIWTLNSRTILRLRGSSERLVFCRRRLNGFGKHYSFEKGFSGKKSLAVNR